MIARSTFGPNSLQPSVDRHRALRIGSSGPIWTASWSCKSTLPRAPAPAPISDRTGPGRRGRFWLDKGVSRSTARARSSAAITTHLENPLARRLIAGEFAPGRQPCGSRARSDELGFSLKQRGFIAVS